MSESHDFLWREKTSFFTEKKNGKRKRVRWTKRKYDDGWRQCDPIGRFFWNFLVTLIFNKVAQIFIDCLGYFENIPVYWKLLWLLFRLLIVIFGLLLFQHLVTLAGEHKTKLMRGRSWSDENRRSWAAVVARKGGIVVIILKHILNGKARLTLLTRKEKQSIQTCL